MIFDSHKGREESVKEIFCCREWRHSRHFALIHIDFLPLLTHFDNASGDADMGGGVFGVLGDNIVISHKGCEEIAQKP